MPVISFLRVRPGRHAPAFKAALLAACAGTFAGSGRVVVSLGEPAPAGLSLPRAMQLDASNSTPWPPYDAAILVEDESRATGLPDDIVEWIDLDHAYRVTPTVIKDDGTIVSGRPSTGIKYLRGLLFHPDLRETAVRRSWAQHAPLAVDVHVGARRYVQWWVDAQLSTDAPGIGGIAELHFGSDSEFAEGFFDSPRGMKEIVQDSGHFIAGGPPRLFARDHVFAAVS